MPGELIVEAHGSFATLVLSSYTNVINLARRRKLEEKRFSFFCCGPNFSIIYVLTFICFDNV